MRRTKIQIMDEAQRVLTMSEDFLDDLNYMEVQRAYGGITLFCSQTESSMKAKSARAIEWEKIDGVCRTRITSSTNDLSTINRYKNGCGEETIEVKSTSVSETASAPELDTLNEEFQGKNSSMAVTTGISEQRRPKVSAEDIQGLKNYTLLGCILNEKNDIEILYFTQVPYYWRWQRDSWELMYRSNFNLKERNLVKFGGFLGTILNMAGGIK